MRPLALLLSAILGGAPVFDGVVLDGVVAQGTSGTGLIDCTGATNWLTHAGRQQCAFIADTTWNTSSEPDDECSKGDASGSVGLTSADDAVTSGLPAGTPSGNYRLVMSGTERALFSMDVPFDNGNDWFVASWLTIDENGMAPSDLYGDTGGDLWTAITKDNGGTEGNCSDATSGNGVGCLGMYMNTTTNLWTDDSNGWTNGVPVHLIIQYNAATDTKTIWRNGVNITSLGSQTGADSLEVTLDIGAGNGGIDQSQHEFIAVNGTITDALACQLAMCGANGAGGGGSNVDEEARATAYGDCQP